VHPRPPGRTVLPGVDHDRLDHVTHRDKLPRKPRFSLQVKPILRVTKLWYAAARVQAASTRPTFDPAGAGALLLAATALCIAVGGLIGWALGSVGIGILVGAVVGVPAGIVSVYRRYRGAI
jgi:hypothetical protein